MCAVRWILILTKLPCSLVTVCHAAIPGGNVSTLTHTHTPKFPFIMLCTSHHLISYACLLQQQPKSLEGLRDNKSLQNRTSITTLCYKQLSLSLLIIKFGKGIERLQSTQLLKWWKDKKNRSTLLWFIYYSSGIRTVEIEDTFLGKRLERRNFYFTKGTSALSVCVPHSSDTRLTWDSPTLPLCVFSELFFVLKFPLYLIGHLATRKEGNDFLKINFVWKCEFLML